MPAKRGFGTTLIERGLAHDLGGQVKMEFPPDGVRASVRAPLPHGADSSQPAPALPR